MDWDLNPERVCNSMHAYGRKHELLFSATSSNQHQGLWPICMQVCTVLDGH